MRKNIKILIILLIILNFAQSSKTYADLKVISYSPLHLNLTFSKIVPLPQFQLLFNQNGIKYTVRNASGLSSYYIIDCQTKQLINLAQQNLQKYILIFTFPLIVANGSLHLDSFMLQATRQSLLQTNYLKQSNQNIYYFQYQINNNTLNSMAIAVVSVVYFLAFTTMIGMHSYNFLAIYIYISLYSPIFTALDYRCAYYLLFQLNHIKKTAMGRFFYLLVPYFFIFITFLLAFISRVTLKKLATRSGVCKQIYYYFSYRLAIIMWQIMCMPIVANISSILLKKVTFQPPYQHLSYMYVYFSIISLLFFSYMAYITVNPQIGQSYQKWSQYIKTSHFEHFYGFHLDIDVKNWKKRNFTFIVSVFRLCIVIFVSFQFINVPNLLLQIFFLIYLFTLRPFKLNFFNYFIIGIQIFVIFFYLYRYLVQLYIGISDQIITSTNITKILLTNIICLCIIVFTYVVLGIYQFYQRMRGTCYKLNREVREKLKQLQLQSDFTVKTDHKQQQIKQSSKLSSKVQSKSSTNRNFLPSPTLSTPKSKSPSLKSNKKKVIIDNKITETSKDYSIKNQSPFKQKSVRNAKQKSSLLQKISLGQQKP